MARRKLAWWACGIAAVAAACHRTPAGDVTKIGSTGYVVQLPAGWTVAQHEVAGFYNVSSQRGVEALISDRKWVSSDVDTDIKLRCAGRPQIERATIGSRGYWFTCKGESQRFPGDRVRITTLVSAVVSHGDGRGSVECGYQTEGDPASLLAMCTSIRHE